MDPKIVSNGEGVRIEFDGWSVSQIRIDYRFALDLTKDDYTKNERTGENGGVGIVIESPFTVEDGAGLPVQLVPAGPRENLCPALKLWGQGITEINISNQSDLRLNFEGTTVDVPHDPSYEAWEVAIVDRKFVARPGGGAPFSW
jgi:hypothetical protein